MLALSPQILGGPGWASHAERFFDRFATIDGARLPGARRFARRDERGPRRVNAELVERVRTSAKANAR